MLDENGKKVTKVSLDYIDKATIHFNGPKHLITHLEKNEKGIEENNYIKKSHISHIELGYINPKGCYRTLEIAYKGIPFLDKVTTYPNNSNIKSSMAIEKLIDELEKCDKISLLDQVLRAKHLDPFLRGYLIEYCNIGLHNGGSDLTEEFSKYRNYRDADIVISKANKVKKYQ